MEKNKVAFLKVLEESKSLSDACEKTGIDRQQFYKWLTDDLQFTKAISRSEVGAILVIDDSLFINAIKGNVNAAKLFLERRQLKDSPGSYIDEQLEILRNLKK